jgi:hypothetical protein
VELFLKNKIMSKIYIENSKFMEFIDELATQMTEMAYGEDTWVNYRDEDKEMRFTDEAQDFYNLRYDEFETLTNNLLGVHSNNDLYENGVGYVSVSKEIDVLKK